MLNKYTKFLGFYYFYTFHYNPLKKHTNILMKFRKEKKNRKLIYHEFSLHNMCSNHILKSNSYLFS